MAVKKAPAKTATKPSAKTAKKAASQASAKKTPAKKTAARKSAPKKAAGDSLDNYTEPELREKVKQQILAGDKGGRPGQWSARKAQLVAHEYEAKGGGYKNPRNTAQKSLKNWGDEHWHTADGKKAIQGGETHRYLPDEAWKKLSPGEKKATDRKKVAGSKRASSSFPTPLPPPQLGSGLKKIEDQAVSKKGDPTRAMMEFSYLGFWNARQALQAPAQSFSPSKAAERSS